MSYVQDGKERITRTELLMQGGHKDLSKIFTEYEIRRWEGNLKVTFHNVKEIKDDDEIMFSLPNFNHIFLVMRRGNGDVYAMTLYPPIRSTFDAWDEDSEVILDYHISGAWDVGDFGMMFHIFKNYRKLPKNMVDRTLGFDPEGNKIKPQSYRKMLKKAGEPGFRHEFPMILRTTLDCGNYHSGWKHREEWKIHSKDIVQNDVKFDSAKFVSDMHMECVNAINRKLDDEDY